MKNKYDIFLKKHGIIYSSLKLIEQDASSRKYFRIKNNDNLIIMDSPPKENNNNRFFYISNYLNQINLSAPRVIQFDKTKGLLIIEDLGNYTFNEALKDNVSEVQLYKRAVDTLVLIHNSQIPAHIPYYSKKTLIDEVNLFIEWFCPNAGIKLSLNSINEWHSIWNSYLNPIIQENNKLVLRDFHADNLFWLPERKSYRRVGIIDFQDALIGNISYDLSSLLEDVRREVSDNTKEKVLKYFIMRSNIKDISNFIRSYRILTAQRNAKIAGIFVRLAKRDGKDKYLKMVNKAISIFKRSIKKAELSEIINWLEKYLVLN